MQKNMCLTMAPMLSQLQITTLPETKGRNSRQVP